MEKIVRKIGFQVNLQLQLLASHLFAVILGMGVVEIGSGVFKADFHNGWIVCLISSLSAIVFTGLSARTILKPLKEMERTIQSFTEGDFRARIPLISVPEINRLAVSFNVMANSIEGIEERRQELVSDLAHELRSPITVIHGYLETIAVGIDRFTPDIQAQLQSETKRLMRLTDNLLELARVEAGYLPLCLENISIPSLLQNVVATFATTSAQANCQLKIQLVNELPLIYVDRDRLNQILVNLISNAIKYTPNGTVIIQAGRERSNVWVSVIDNGSGIAPEHLHKVFERFWRADLSRDTSTGGNGIGLAITKRLVELQGGKIEVESALDRGSIFRFSIPIAY
jgi:signal transduction histidine kinase